MDLESYDLHCHSTASDGALTPQQLADLASERGILMLALTDHDTVAGVPELQRAAAGRFEVITGTELTCSWNNRVLHIVGLDMDIGSDSLQAYLQALIDLRRARSRKIADQLIKMGLPDLYKQAQEVAQGMIGRPHFAKAMVDAGVVANEQQAFKKYLGAGKKGDVKMEWPSLMQAVAAIKSAGGIAVLAHPTKYKMTFTKLRSVIGDFVDVGGEAIEVAYPGVTKDHQGHLLRIADQHGLMLSAGSDFHSPEHGWTDLGKYPAMPVQGKNVLDCILSRRGVVSPACAV